MKQLLYSACVLLPFILAACSNDDSPSGNSRYPEKTYTAADGLSISVGGAPILGKSVTYRPDKKNGSRAQLLLAGYFDFGSIPDIPKPLAKTLPTSGVIPGDLTTTIPILLTEESDKSVFSGSCVSEYCTYNYSGSISDQGLDLAISNVKLKDTSMCGIWIPDEYRIDKTSGQILSSPVYALWESGADINIDGKQVPMQQLLTMLMAMPLIKEEIEGNTVDMPVPELISIMLKEVEFCDDGNIIATIAEDEDDRPVALQTPPNMTTYVVTGANDFNFYLNPSAVIALEEEDLQATMSRSRSISFPLFEEVFNNAVTQLVAAMEALPMHYNLEGSNMQVYLGSEVLIHLLKTDVLPLLREDYVVAKLIELANQKDELKDIAKLLPDILDDIAVVIEKTTRLEIGMALHN